MSDLLVRRRRVLSLLVLVAVAPFLVVGVFLNVFGPIGGTTRAIAASDEKVKNQTIYLSKIAPVVQHPRCVNCHAAGERPLQGDAMEPHQPPVARGADGLGNVGMRCTTCHQNENIDHARLPGVENWHMAPASMTWEGKTTGEICRQIMDPGRNGGKSKAQLIEHMKTDALVGWGWAPGAGRTAVPGTQKAFGESFAAWIEGGGHCPS